VVWVILVVWVIWVNGMNDHKALNSMGIIMLDINGGSWHYDDHGDPHRQLRRL
jgi:hypothetical protein